MTKDNTIYPFYSYEVSGVSEEDYSCIPEIISTIQKTENLVPHAFILLDYFKREVIYVSNKPNILAGYKPIEFIENFQTISKGIFSQQKFEILYETIVQIYRKLSFEDRKSLLWEQTIVAQNKGGRSHSIIDLKMQHLKLSSTGDLWLGLISLSASSRNKGTLHLAPTVTNLKTGEVFSFTSALDAMINKEPIQLSESEKQLLLFASNGYSITEISNKLCKSPASVKRYRAALLSKLGVETMAEAITLCQQHGII